MTSQTSQPSQLTGPSSSLEVADSHNALALEGMIDLNRRALESFARDAALERFRTYRLIVSGTQRLAAEHRLDAKIPITRSHQTEVVDGSPSQSLLQ
jgi:hypothetical protein